MTESVISDTITVRVGNLPLLADVGINPDEVGRRQPLVISVDLSLWPGPVTTIHETIDYRRIAEAAECLAQVHIPLIETFAWRLGKECVSWPRVIEARVKVDKPFALTRGLAGVELTVRSDVAAGAAEQG